MSYQREELVQAAEILAVLCSRNLSTRQSQKLEKVLLLLLYGELYGLNTLNKLLDSYGVKSNDYSVLWSKLSCDYIVSLMNSWLWLLFAPAFMEVISQSESTQSRSKLTIVLDGSIFKTWLKEERFGQYFAKYYSGQYGKAVYGFNILLCGISLGGIFYPLHFQLRRKIEKDVIVAQKMLKRVHNKLLHLAKEAKMEMPTLYLSVDSGFRSKDFVNWCEQARICYIGVPKQAHIIYLHTRQASEKLPKNRRNIKQLKELFIQKEQAAQQAAQQACPTGVNPQAFQLRLRVYYQCLDREVTLLLFRLNGSKKVSVILATDLNIKAKTLRSRWFERTKIELLFRTIKHDLRIQQSCTRNRLSFLKKFAFALVKSIYSQLLTQKVKKTHSSIRRIGYEKIKQLLQFHHIEKEYLNDLMNTPFAW